jgi:hypothetical protein
MEALAVGRTGIGAIDEDARRTVKGSLTGSNESAAQDFAVC